MIDSNLHTPSIAIHAVKGPLQSNEIEAAGRWVNTQETSDIRVVWDLRNAELDELTYVDAQRIKLEIAVAVQKAPDTLRAFVVSSKEQREAVVMLVGHLREEWPWRVFSEFDDAVGWLKK